MTLKELKDLEHSVQEQRFLTTCSDPILYGIEKASFEEKQLQMLIEAARQLHTQAADEKLGQWSRMLEKAARSRAHLEKLRDEMRPQPRSRFAARVQSLVPQAGVESCSFKQSSRTDVN